MITFEPKYKIGQPIFHKTKESDEGLILDITYSHLRRQIYYVVALGFNDEVTCIEQELSETKNFG